MNCLHCARSNFSISSDTGSTEDSEFVISGDTGGTANEDFLAKLEGALFKSVRDRRRLQVFSKRFWLARIDSLSGYKSGPETIRQISWFWDQPIVVVHAMHRQCCLFVRGISPRAICITCALQLAAHRRILLLVVREQEVFHVVRGRRRADLRRLLARMGYD